jgi:hypothetical protein
MTAASAFARPLLDASREASLKRLELLTWFTDNAVKIPGTNRTVGADGVLSIIPGVGSFAGTALSLYLVAEAWRHGVRGHTLAKMGGNIAIDTLIGAVPAVGWLFDMGFKANQRNLVLLKEFLAQRP